MTLAATRGFYKIRSCLKNQKYSPSLLIKLFDTLLKPIVLYGSEVWGGFSLKLSSSDSLVEQFFASNKTCYEKLNMRLIKMALHVHNKVSNLGCLGELGRFPLSIDIIISVINYFIRLHSFSEGSLMHNALISQVSALHNSAKTLTYSQCSEKLISQLGLCRDNIAINQVLNKYTRKKFNVKNKCTLQKKIAIHISMLYINQLRIIQAN